jgi:hypothetical protein
LLGCPALPLAWNSFLWSKTGENSDISDQLLGNFLCARDIENFQSVPQMGTSQIVSSIKDLRMHSNIDQVSGRIDMIEVPGAITPGQSMRAQQLMHRLLSFCSLTNRIMIFRSF